jgi:hypothetical protein
MNVSIPKFSTITDKDFPNSAKKIKNWINNIENLDVNVRIKEFYQLILKVNRGGIAPKSHIEILELLRPTANFCLKHLHSKYSKIQLPLTSKMLSIFKLALTLTNEMALGYKIALLQLVEKKTFLGGSWIKLSSVRAMQYLNDELLRYYEIYTNPKDSTWQDLNAIYLKSIELKIHTNGISDPEDNNKRHSVEGLFKVACLVSLSDTSTLRRGEAKMLLASANKWLPFFEVRESLQSKDEHYYTSDLSSKVAPNTLEEDKINNKTLIYIILDKLIIEIAKKVKKEKGLDTKLLQDGTLNITALKRLHKNWLKKENLRFSRNVDSKSIIVEVGLINISDHILEDLVKDDAPIAEKKPEPIDEFELAGIPPKRDDQFLMHLNFDNENNAPDVSNVWESISRGNVLTPNNEKELQKKREERALLKDIVKDHLWTVEDTSSSGYKLQWTGTTSPVANVGEVIGLREVTKDGATWHIAVIRWLHYKNETKFNAGVQVISNQVIIAKVARSTKKTKQATVQQNCLFLPEIEVINQPVTLLVPAFMYNIGDMIDLEINQTIRHLIIKGVYEHTGSFTQFVVVNAPKKRTKSAPDAITEEASDEYDSVWGSL